MYISKKLIGIPYGKNKKRGDVNAPKTWSNAVIEQTKNLPKLKDACLLKVTFLLPPDKYPKDFPFGSDLDNLLKRLLDALKETIFSEAMGKDSCIISMNIMKTKVSSPDEAGALLEILPVSV